MLYDIASIDGVSDIHAIGYIDRLYTGANLICADNFSYAGSRSGNYFHDHSSTISSPGCFIVNRYGYDFIVNNYSNSYTNSYVFIFDRYAFIMQ